MRRAFVLSVMLAATGCDVGGLLIVKGKEQEVDAGPPPVVGLGANDIVSAGTVAGNDKYKIVFTLGQPTPNQNVETSPSNRLNGGLVGATQDK